MEPCTRPLSVLGKVSLGSPLSSAGPHTPLSQWEGIQARKGLLLPVPPLCPPHFPVLPLAAVRTLGGCSSHAKPFSPPPLAGLKSSAHGCNSSSPAWSRSDLLLRASAPEMVLPSPNLSPAPALNSLCLSHLSDGWFPGNRPADTEPECGSQHPHQVAHNCL